MLIYLTICLFFLTYMQEFIMDVVIEISFRPQNDSKNFVPSSFYWRRCWIRLSLKHKGDGSPDEAILTPFSYVACVK